MVKHQRITNEELLELDVDLLIPAALEGVIGPHNVDRVRASVIAEAANGPIEGEVDEVLEDLESQRLSQRTLRQQQRILQRMLDASRSLHTQGQDRQRRRSITGEDLPYAGPDGLPDDLGQSEDALRRAMERALQAPYPEEYREVIRSYYEQLYQDAHGRAGATE